MEPEPQRKRPPRRPLRESYERARGRKEAVLATLRNAGFSPEMTHHAFHALEGHIDGYSLRQVNFKPTPGELESLASDFMSGFDAEQYPFLVEDIRGHVRNEFKTKSGFEFGLDLILDGMERVLRSGRA